MRKFFQYISERILLRNIIFAGLILLIGLFVILQVLKIYTRHGQNLSVPDFTGLTLSDAELTATARDLRIEVFDSVYLSDFERGTVVDQHPAPFFNVKKNRKIFLTMNAVNPEKVAIPDLVGLTVRQARARLESFGLKTGDISYTPNIGVNIVLAQEINGRDVTPGDSIVKNSSIDLVAGMGLGDVQTTVPNLLGLTLEEAKIVSSDQYLSIDAVVTDQTIVTEEDQNTAQIFRQRPESGENSTLLQGSSIDVWLTLDTLKLQEVIQPEDSLTN